MTHVNLLIATPGHSVTNSYLKSLLLLLHELNTRKISWSWTGEYSSNVADAREITLSGTFENDPSEQRPLQGQLTYDKLLWIDSDISFTPEDVIKVYESDKDVISGAYLLATGEVVAYKEKLKSGFKFEEILSMKEPIKIHSAGMGFICFKSGIFEQLSRPWFQQVQTKTMFDNKEYIFPIMGEDISLCERVNQLGYEIWLDPSVKVIHTKTVKLTWEGISI